MKPTRPSAVRSASSRLACVSASPIRQPPRHTPPSSAQAPLRATPPGRHHDHRHTLLAGVARCGLAWRVAPVARGGGSTQADDRCAALAHGSVEVVFEQPAGLGMAQLANGALFDLSHALAGHFELLANLFERVILI